MEENNPVYEMLLYYKDYDKKMYDLILIFFAISVTYSLLKNWTKFYKK